MADDKAAKAVLKATEQALRKHAQELTKTAKRRTQAAQRVVEKRFPHAGKQIVDALGKDMAQELEKDVAAAAADKGAQLRPLLHSRYAQPVSAAVAKSGVDAEALVKAIAEAAEVADLGRRPSGPLHIDTGIRTGAEGS